MSGYFTKRITVAQARERFPSFAYAQIGGGWVSHFITERLEVPAGFVFALCREAGFASEDAADEDMVCLKCLHRARQEQR